MIIRKYFFIITALSALMLSSLVSAGQLYRFKGEDGTLTLSTSLPPSAAQKGYDILDDRNMEVIKHVPRALTPAEIAERKKQAEQAAEAKHQAEIAEKIAEKKRQQQASYDQNLLNSFPTEHDLTQARDEDINYRKGLLNDAINKQPKLQKQLEALQQQAAQQELNGHGVSQNLTQSIKAARQELRNNRHAIKILKAEIESLKVKYDKDLTRLRYLLKSQNSD